MKMKRKTRRHVVAVVMYSASLFIDRAGEQVIRTPRASDAVGGALQTAYPLGGTTLPEEMVALLQKLDRQQRPH